MHEIIAWVLILLSFPLFIWMTANILRWNKDDKAYRDSFSHNQMTDDELNQQIIGAAYDNRVMRRSIKGAARHNELNNIIDKVENKK